MLVVSQPPLRAISCDARMRSGTRAKFRLVTHPVDDGKIDYRQDSVAVKYRGVELTRFGGSHFLRTSAVYQSPTWPCPLPPCQGLLVQLEAHLHKVF